MKTIFLVLCALPFITALLITLIIGGVLISPFFLIGWLFWLKSKKSRPTITEVKKTAPDPVKMAMEHFFKSKN